LNGQNKKEKAAGSLNEIPCPIEEKRRGKEMKRRRKKNFFERKSQRILTNLFAPK